MNKPIYFSKSKKKAVRHRYCKRIYGGRFENHIFWGIRLEVLFRGFSHEEIFQIEAEIRELIGKKKSQALSSGCLKEIVLENCITKPFKDEVT